MLFGMLEHIQQLFSNLIWAAFLWLLCDKVHQSRILKSALIERSKKSKIFLYVNFVTITDEPASKCVSQNDKKRCGYPVKHDSLTIARNIRHAFAETHPHDEAFKRMLLTYARSHLCQRHVQEDISAQLATQWHEELLDLFEEDVKASKIESLELQGRQTTLFPGAFSTTSSPIEPLSLPDFLPTLPSSWITRFTTVSYSDDKIFELYSSDEDVGVEEIRNTALNKLESKARDEGCVYIFKQSKFSEYVKIGYTTNSAETRLNAWDKKCGIEIIETWFEKVDHARRVETMVHTCLASCRYKYFGCKGTDSTCGESHFEWFKMDFEMAKSVVAFWCKWMNESSPYTLSGVLKASAVREIYGTKFTTDLEMLLDSNQTPTGAEKASTRTEDVVEPSTGKTPRISRLKHESTSSVLSDQETLEDTSSIDQSPAEASSMDTESEHTFPASPSPRQAHAMTLILQTPSPPTPIGTPGRKTPSRASRSRSASKKTANSFMDNDGLSPSTATTPEAELPDNSPCLAARKPRGITKQSNRRKSSALGSVERSPSSTCSTPRSLSGTSIGRKKSRTASLAAGPLHGSVDGMDEEETVNWRSFSSPIRQREGSSPETAIEIEE